MKRLPIGISTLSTIIENDMTYVDKTHIAYKLVSVNGRYFLSRPRRFGKSLFLDTLKEIFQGNRELFKGLYIYDKWDWSKKIPVIKIDFTGGIVKNKNELVDKINYILHIYQDKYDVKLIENGLSNKFSELIRKISQKTNSKIVILVDEYDKPMLDNINDLNISIEIRESLKDIYSVIKEQDANIQFVFITGVSKFSKVSIFSGINNLKDITLSTEYATICGYTQNDLETVFREHLAGVDWEELKRWYNGYSFLGEPVYNPFDILLFISENKVYKNYWFETGTPTFLIELFKKNRYFIPNLERLEVGEEILSSFELNNIQVETILFQSGYLTIKDYSNKMGVYKFSLSYPNEEVKRSLNEYIITSYTNFVSEKTKFEDSLYDILRNGEVEKLGQIINKLFTSISYRNYTNNDIIEYEGYYASVLYSFFAAINCEIIAEDTFNYGQADLTVKMNNNVYVMEIKVVKSVKVNGNSALKQIEEIGYSKKYTGQSGVRVFEIGLIFSSKKRNLIKFDWKEV